MDPRLVIPIVFVAACSSESTALARRDCSPLADSAKASCIAVDTVSQAYGFAVKILSLERTDIGYRVRTIPANGKTRDGMGLVEFDRAGSVRRVVLGDSL